MTFPTDRQYMPPLVGYDSALLAFLPFPALIFDIETLYVSESNGFFCREKDKPLLTILSTYDYKVLNQEEIRTIVSIVKKNKQFSIHKLITAEKEVRSYEISFQQFSDSRFIFFYLNPLSESHLSEEKNHWEQHPKEDIPFEDETGVKDFLQLGSSYGIYRITTDGSFIFSNESLARILGYESSGELVQSTFTDIFYNPENSMHYFLKNENEDFNIREIRLKKKGGELVWCRDFHRTIFSKNGEVLCFEGLIENITDEKEAEELSKSNLFRTQELLDSASEGIGQLDANYHIVFCNKSFAAYFSQRPEIITGTWFPDLFSTNHTELLAELEINKFGLETTFELCIIQKDHTELFLEIHSIPKFDIGNTYSGSVITITNISRYKLSEKELEKTRLKAMEADRLKSSFLTNMSHEIRTPMNSILGFSSLLKRKGLPKGKRDQYLEIICNKGNHLMSVISDIIDITKIEEHQIKLSVGPCDLNQLMEDLFEKFQYELAKTGNPVKLFLNSAVQGKNDLIIIDSERLTQIMNNLLNNSLKFTESGYIEFGFRHIESQTLLFYVKDTGIGVPPEMGEVIFERFRQADESYTRGFEGTGLGLAICKGLINLMAGNIWVESDGKNGSIFNFTIPSVYYEGSPLPLQENLIGDGTIQNKTVLVIEDDLASFQLLKEYLELTNCQVLHAFDGNEALDILKESRPIDLILLDIQLPVMDGYEVARSIRLINTTVPIIAQTAHAMGSDKFKCMESGCNDYLSKPIQFDVLEKMVKIYLC